MMNLKYLIKSEELKVPEELVLGRKVDIIILQTYPLENLK